MAVLNALSALFLGIWVAVFSSACTEEKLFVYLEKTFPPEQVFIKDIIGDNLSGNTSCEIFDSFAYWALALVGIKTGHKTHPGQPPSMALKSPCALANAFSIRGTHVSEGFAQLA
jgi:hypothetical protein